MIKTGLWTHCLTDEAMDKTLESIPIVASSQENAMVFLHGLCGIFALALYDAFGYHISWAIDDAFGAIDDDEGQPPAPFDYLTHAFCYMDGDEDGLFIDVRGATGDLGKFFSPFEDWFTPPGIAVEDPDAGTLRQTIVQTMGTSTYDAYYHAAASLIASHHDWYAL